MFDNPAQGNEAAAVHYFLSGYTKLHWVICRKCSFTGYWGGHGGHRRVRWGYGDEGLLKTAEHHNRLMRGEAVTQPL
ncbi:hypothetical protein ACVIGB_000814 [Bradyrhizobium sp. USDA 4341]